MTLTLISSGNKRLLAALGIAALLALRAQAGTLPLNEKSAFEHSLETRVEDVLKEIVGPNRAKVVVEADLDFTMIESLKFEKEKRPDEKDYLWSGRRPGAQKELLPGVPVIEGGAQSPAPAPRSYERTNSYPLKFLKGLKVTLILDERLSGQSQALSSIVSDVAGISPKRGDSLRILQASFAPPWETVWHSPVTIEYMVKSIPSVILGFLALGIAAFGFSRLAGAIRNLGKSRPAPASEAKLISEAPKPALEAPERPSEEESSGSIVFNVRPDQEQVLVEMLQSEDPDNIALVAAHLAGDVRSRFIENLPSDTAGRVLVSLARQRFVEPDFILKLKAELEHRLSGSVGGIRRLVEAISAAGMDERSRLIEDIRVNDPRLADEVRGHVFLIKDLVHLDREEWSVLRSQITQEEWAAALSHGPQEVLDSLNGVLSERARIMLDQMVAAKKTDTDARRAAQEKIGRIFPALVKEGRIRDHAISATLLTEEVSQGG